MEEKLKEQAEKCWDEMMKKGYSAGEMPSKKDLYIQGWIDCAKELGNKE